MVLKKFIFVFSFLVLLANLVSAIPTVDFNVEPVFYEGDTISFSYYFTSQQDEPVKYMASVGCDGSFEPLLQIEEITLNKNEPFIGEYVYGVVDDDVKSGHCTASIFILEPYQAEFTKSFEVVNSLELPFDVLFCKDSLCAEKAKIFLQGENIYLDYESSVENPSIKATLKYPDNSTKKVSLPGTIKADQIGTYELEVTATKEGYKTVINKEQFGVIESNAKFEDVSENISGDAGSFFEEEPEKRSGKSLYLIGLLIFGILIEKPNSLIN